VTNIDNIFTKQVN